MPRSILFRAFVPGGAVLFATHIAAAQYPPPQQPYPPQPYPAQPYPPPPPPQYAPPPQPYPPPPYAPPPPAYPPPSPDADKEREEKEKEEEAKKPGWDLDAELLGLRGSTLGVSGGDRDARTYGMTVASMGVSNTTRSLFTYRAVGRSLLGGGSGGFEGELGGTLAIGLGFLVDDMQGPFARVGVQGYILGNDSFFHSNIQFPEGSIGWHLGSRDGFLLEGGLTTGPMLDGRFNVGDISHRRLGSSGAFGAYVDAFIGPLTGTVEWIRVDAKSLPGNAVDTIDGHVCLTSGRAKKQSGFGLCFDGRFTRGDVHYGVPEIFSTAETKYFGLTIGFGFAQAKPK